jgi:competence protein ComFB
MRAQQDACEECLMKLNERYDVEKMKNRTEEMVFEAIQKEIDKGGDTCSCEECVLDLAAYALNHVRPRYYTSLLAPLTPRPEAARKAQVEIELAIASGLKKLKSHRHHER